MNNMLSNKKKQRYSILTALAVMLLMSSTVLASENQVISKQGESEVSVKALVNSNYSVKIPKVITLDGKEKSATYYVNVTGDIPGYKYIEVKPDTTTITLTQENIYNPDASITISQPKTIFRSASYTGTFNDETDVYMGNQSEGTLTASNLTAGTWTGSFNFLVDYLDDPNAKSITVSAVDKDGKDLNATASLIEDDSADELLDKLVETGWINSKDEVDELIKVDTDSFDNIATATFTLTNIGNVGDTIAIFHYNETDNEWEYIGKDDLDENNQIKADFTSFSPVAFVRVDPDGSYTILTCKEHQFEGGDSSKHGTCKVCGTECPAEVESTDAESHACSYDCGYTGSHEFEKVDEGKHKCSICDYTEEHTIDYDGTNHYCIKDCGYLESHTIMFNSANHYCLRCNYSENHTIMYSDTSHYCENCDYLDSHIILYDNTSHYCLNCGYFESHTIMYSDTSHYCEICDYSENHTISYDSTSHYCSCGYQCTHSLVQGADYSTCNNCGYTCYHNDWTTGSDYSTCNNCGYTCKHSFDPTTGKCSTCGYQCEHPEWTENNDGSETCTTCGYTCDHSVGYTIYKYYNSEDDYELYYDLFSEWWEYNYYHHCKVCGKTEEHVLNGERLVKTPCLKCEYIVPPDDES